MMIIKNNKGFTIIELIISIFILSVGLVGVFNALSVVTVLTAGSADRVTATYLAQEGMEIVRNIRDTNWLAMDTCPRGGGEILTPQAYIVSGFGHISFGAPSPYNGIYKLTNSQQGYSPVYVNTDNQYPQYLALVPPSNAFPDTTKSTWIIAGADKYGTISQSPGFYNQDPDPTTSSWNIMGDYPTGTVSLDMTNPPTDNGGSCGHSWISNGLDACANGCEADYKSTSMSGGQDYLKMNTAGFYVYDQTTLFPATKFKRKITIKCINGAGVVDNPCNSSDYIIKTVINVAWDEKASILNPSRSASDALSNCARADNCVTVEEAFYNWYNKKYQ